MSQVSKRKIDQKVYDKLFSLLPEFMGRLSRNNHQQDFVNTLFYTTEKTMIAKRLAIAFMLTKEYTYSQMISKLKVSQGTVAKVAEMVGNADKSFISELQNISKEQQFVDFLELIGYKIETMLPPKGGNWSVWRRRIEKDKQKSEQPF
ncbi:MAG: Trp family transcriptional regulator [bacterium]